MNLGTLREKRPLVQTPVYFGLCLPFSVTLAMSSQLEANLSSVSTVRELPTPWKTTSAEQWPRPKSMPSGIGQMVFLMRAEFGATAGIFQEE